MQITGILLQTVHYEAQVKLLPALAGFFKLMPDRGGGESRPNVVQDTHRLVIPKTVLKLARFRSGFELRWRRRV